MMLSLSSGLGVGDVVYFNVSILNDKVVEEMFENFTVHLNDTARVSVNGTCYAAVNIREDETDGEFELYKRFLDFVSFGADSVFTNWTF